MKRHFDQHIILLAFLCLPSLCSFASQPERMELRPYLFNRYDLHNQNWDISQDPGSHVVYFANSEGLIKYNGISWQKYTLKEPVPIRSVKAHHGGYIFTGSFEEFGFWRYDSKGDLNYYSLAGDALIEKNDEIWKIYALDGKIYFQSFTSIYIYDFEGIKKVKAPYTMLFLHKLQDRLMAQILESGLYWFEDGDFQFIENSGFLADKKVHDIIPYDARRWLICTANEGLYLFDGEDFTYFDSAASDFLARQTFNTARQLNDTSFAFGSILNGLIITDQHGSIQRRYNTDNGLDNNTVLSLFMDADQGLWIGMDQGVNYIDLMSPFTHYRSRNGTLGTIYALLEHDDWLYIGTNHGLFRTEIEPVGDIYHFHNLEFIPGSHGQVWTLLSIEGQVICGHNDGTFLVSDTGLQIISDVSGGWSYIPYDDFILGGTYTDIVVLEEDEQGRIRFRNKLENYSQPTRYLETDYLGYVWASHHQRGIYKIELSDDLYSAREAVYYPSINEKSFNIRVFKVNNRIVFITGENIYTFDFVRNEIIPFTALTDHLGEYSNAAQISHHQGNKYWFLKEDKLALFEVGLNFSARKVYEIIHEGINLPQRNIQLASPDDNTILIPNPHSFDAYNLAKHRKRKDTVRLGLDKLLFYGDNDSLVFYNSFENVKAPWDSNNLRVSFRDPSRFGKTQKTYEYRIRELDGAWQSTTGDQFTYLNLNHGHYTLEIRVDNENVISQPFSIAKPWFYTNFALVVYALLFAALLWLFFRFFRYELNRQKELASMEIKQNDLERELDYTSQELMFSMRHLIQKDNILNNLQKQINAIKEQYARYPVKQIKKMERIIKESLGHHNVEWENAAQNLKLTQQGFFMALKEKYPCLTPNDLRLCAYLRLNLSTKEIARLLNISPRGVEISRHRLRKKLNLPKDEHLFDFLMREENSLSEKS